MTISAHVLLPPRDFRAGTLIRVSLLSLSTWVVMILVFAAADWVDGDRLGDSGGSYLDYLAMWSRGTLPWIFLFPASFRLGEASIPGSMGQRGLIALTGLFVCLALTMGYTMSLSQILSSASLGEILSFMSVMDWFWDAVFFILAFASGLVFGKPLQAEPIRPRQLEVRSARGSEFIPIKDVLGATSQGNYVCLHLTTRDVLHRTTLSELERMLGACGFHRIHPSHLVHLASIRSAKTHSGRVRQLGLKNSAILPVSSRFSRPIYRAIHNGEPSAEIHSSHQAPDSSQSV